MKIFCMAVIFLDYILADDGVLDINVPNVLVKAQDTGNIALQSDPLARDLYLEPGPGGRLLFDNEDVLKIIKRGKYAEHFEEEMTVSTNQNQGNQHHIPIAQSLPPVWLPHSHNGFFGTFQGGQSIHIKLEARDPQGGTLVYKLVAGDFPQGVTLDEVGGYLNGIVPDIERFYSFTIRAIGNNTKYADSVFKMEVLSHDNCKSNPCQHQGTCQDESNNTYTCFCPEPYGGQRCQTDCRSNAFGVSDKNKIPDAQMSAYLSQGSYQASNGRYGSGSFWCGTNNNAWLQVDLGSSKMVYRTRYQYYNSNLYTGSYTLSVSLDGRNFHYLNDTNGIHSFGGGKSTYTHDLPTPTTARFVRYHPTSYRSGYYPCMKVELYGC